MNHGFLSRLIILFLLFGAQVRVLADFDRMVRLPLHIVDGLWTIKATVFAMDRPVLGRFSLGLNHRSTVRIASDFFLPHSGLGPLAPFLFWGKDRTAHIGVRLGATDRFNLPLQLYDAHRPFSVDPFRKEIAGEIPMGLLLQKFRVLLEYSESDAIALQTDARKEGVPTCVVLAPKLWTHEQLEVRLRTFVPSATLPLDSNEKWSGLQARLVGISRSSSRGLSSSSGMDKSSPKQMAPSWSVVELQR